MVWYHYESARLLEIILAESNIRSIPTGAIMSIAFSGLILSTLTTLNMFGFYLVLAGALGTVCSGAGAPRAYGGAPPQLFSTRSL